MGGAVGPMDMTFATFIGLPGRSNQVLYFCPSKPVQHVIYFQGDIQVNGLDHHLVGEKDTTFIIFFYCIILESVEFLLMF